ncbi:unnamed protein product [Adineta ricciae]|uniref:NAD(P)(+)--arginine ADP-ribosyltransferase n=1 Tax=Adineta ricciae TaxID=249248 RepID=A0A815JPP2_ADIRI|nr:unnamed protein product [Adineta ricciae]CAF1384952.1 unnamed protein product [Adineta ricciae]
MGTEDDQATEILWERYSDVLDEPRRMLPPLAGFAKMPLVSIEEAVKPLVSHVFGIEIKATQVKEECKSLSNDKLSIDEMASIRLYTKEWSPRDRCLYVVLNKSLRAEDRQEMKPWFLYLRLIIGAFSKIPSTRCHVFRGVKLDLSQQYLNISGLVWWSFSSCTSVLDVLKKPCFCGTKGERTIFDIICHSGKDISRYSTYPTESEIVLLPGTEFKVIGCLNLGHGLHMIKLQQIEPQFPWLEKIPGEISTSAEFDISEIDVDFPPVPPISPNKDADNRKESVERLIQGYPPLGRIVLSGRQLSNQDMAVVAEQAITKKKCTSLSLQHNEIRSDGMTVLAKAIHDSITLEEIDFSHTNMTDAVLYELAKELSTHETISIIAWTFCKIGIKKKVDKAPIKTLNLSNNKVMDEGARYLVDVIKGKPSLTVLRLDGNLITDVGVKLLAEALSNPRACLKKLYLDNNKQITDASVDVLISMFKANESLDTLWLTECKLTQHGRQSLRQEAASKRNFRLNIENFNEV